MSIYLIYLRFSKYWFKNNIKFDKEVVLITGAASGIGQIIARKFVEVGSSVILLDINAEGLQKTYEELTIIQTNPEAKVYTVQCDVSKSSEVKEKIKQVQKKIYPKYVTTLINNAGIVIGKKLLELNEEEIQRTFNINTLAHFWALQSILPDMIKHNSGLIVTVSSVLSMCGVVGLSDYCASKWACNGMHESVRLELRAQKCDGVHTLLVCPYAIDTGMFSGIFESEKHSKIVKRLFPNVKPETVASQIFQAIQRRDLVVVGCFDVWWQATIFSWLNPISRILPIRLMDNLVCLLGGIHAMDSFRGRKAKPC